MHAKAIPLTFSYMSKYVLLISPINIHKKYQAGAYMLVYYMERITVIVLCLGSQVMHGVQSKLFAVYTCMLKTIWQFKSKLTEQLLHA
jgi:calcineurin-like phosphoesterase